MPLLLSPLQLLPGNLVLRLGVVEPQLLPPLLSPQDLSPGIYAKRTACLQMVG